MNQRRYRILLVVLFIIISYFAFTPLREPVAEELPDKVNHALAFLSLAFATDGSFRRLGFGWQKIAALLGYGLLIEIVQLGIPNRSFDLVDVAADAVGIAVYWVGRRMMKGRAT